MAHVKICTPFYSDYQDAYKQSLILLSKACTPWTWEHQACQGVNPGLCRNMLINGGESSLIKQRLDKAITHYLFVDADVSFWPDNVTALLERRVPLISGAYRARSVADSYQAGVWDGVQGSVGQYVSTRSTGVVAVDWVGAGFLMVTREALESMEFPWYRHEIIRAMLPSPMTPGSIEYHACETEEDVGFCMNATAAGIPILLDCDVHAAHDIDGDRCRPSTGRPDTVLSPVAYRFGMRDPESHPFSGMSV